MNVVIRFDDRYTLPLSALLDSLMRQPARRRQCASGTIAVASVDLPYVRDWSACGREPLAARRN